jgi:hypothetical protein
MKEIDAHFDAYEHLKHLPSDGEALIMLRKAASMVKPTMRKRGWKVKTLGEFLPDEPRLLGKGEKPWTTHLANSARSQHQPHRQDPRPSKISP